jgi:hypothetical protein
MKTEKYLEGTLNDCGNKNQPVNDGSRVHEYS